MDRFSRLLVDVDAAFTVTARGLGRWDDPHPDRSPRDEEYSRSLDPAKWRIVGARVDAWTDVLISADLADAERDVDVEWLESPTSATHRVDRLMPRRRGALPLVLARSRVAGIDDAGVTIGTGDPVVTAGIIPDCGCDACDSGSQNELDRIDRCIGGIVDGSFRHLWRRVSRPPRPPGFFFRPAPESPPPVDDSPVAETWALSELETIIVLETGWSAADLTERRDVDAILADPVGWSETTGSAWFGES